MTLTPPHGRNGSPVAVRKRWNDVARKAIFGNTAHFISPPHELLAAKRLPSSGLRPPIGFWSDKQQRNVLCESGAELRVFSWLERSPEVRWYQEQPAAVPYRPVPSGQAGSYYPDVAVLDDSGRLVIVEVKPLFEMHRQDALIKATAALDYFGPRGIGYLLTDPNGRTVSDAAGVDYDRKVAETVESLFFHGPVPFRLVRNLLRMRCGRFERNAFISMVMNRDWGVFNAPGVRIFKLPEGVSFGRLMNASIKA